ncbi:hypothetical protein EOM82_03680, partial [bacterium]|nr:hypothetical protein [bacterium]
MTKFGVAGNSNSFYEQGHLRTVEAAKWCKDRGIDLFEYSFGKGINMSDSTAEEIGRAFNNNGVEMSVHAPYYINFANQDPIMIGKSVDYVIRSLTKLQALNCGDRLVFHPAAQGKQERLAAVNLARDNIKILERMARIKIISSKISGKAVKLSFGKEDLF